MPDEKPPFTTDVPPINAAGLIEDMTKGDIQKVLGTLKEILYIGHREVKAYTVEDMRIYIWPDSRRRENSIFISGEYVGKNHLVSWYKDRKLVAETNMKVQNQRDFIERCVLGEITAEGLNK